MLNNQNAQLILPPDVSEPNQSASATGFPEIDFALELMQAQAAGNFKLVAGDMRKFKGWMDQLALAFERYAAENNRIVNGQIEFPTPGASDPTGNIKVSYVELLVPESGAGTTTTPFKIAHGYGDGTQGQQPRGWFQMANSEGGSGVRLYDSILSSSNPSAYNATAAATCTATAATTVTATAGAVSWVNTGVLAGDQIKLTGSVTVGAATASSTSGSSSVPLSGAPTTTPVVGWWMRLTAIGSDTTLHRIDAWDSATNTLTVSPGYLSTNGAVTWAMYAIDQEWRDITVVTAGPPDVLTLSSTNGTEIPAGTTLCDYIIRRPPDATYAWVRAIGGGVVPFETTVCFF